MFNIRKSFQHYRILYGINPHFRWKLLILFTIKNKKEVGTGYITMGVQKAEIKVYRAPVNNRTSI